MALAQPLNEPHGSDTLEPATGTDGDDDAVGESGEEIDPDTDPKEVVGTPYYFLGLRFRNYVVPAFIINIFADGGSTVNAFSFGPELTYRRSGLELDFALSYVDLSFDPVLFKGKDDPIIKYEEVSSSLKMIQASVDMLFELYVSERSRFAVLFGGGVGFGGVFGELRENQIYPKDPARPDTENLSEWRRCGGVDNPDVRDPGSDGRYCDDSNDHYGNYAEPSWAHGGSKPFLYPYLTFPQVSFRLKPIKQLQTRLDLGFSFSNGFFFGLGAGYGF